MFPKAIHIKSENEIRYGRTQVGFYQTKAQIEKLLDKHGCDKAITCRDGTFHILGFEYEGKSYMITIPNVYVKERLVDRIGIRIVYRYLEIILELAKERAIDFEGALLCTKMVHTPDGDMPLGEALKHIPEAQLYLPKGSNLGEVENGI